MDINNECILCGAHEMQSCSCHPEDVSLEKERREKISYQYGIKSYGIEILFKDYDEKSHTKNRIESLELQVRSWKTLAIVYGVWLFLIFSFRFYSQVKALYEN